MPLDPLTETDVLSILASRIPRGQGTWVLTPNLDILRQYRSHPSVRSLFHTDQGGADLCLADGMPLVWASRLARRPVPERVAGSSLALSLARLAAQKGWSIFLLGGKPGAADRASAVLQLRYPGLNIAGTCCPPLGFEKDPAQMESIRQQLSAANPDIVYVALGFPKQERLTKCLRAFLPRATFIGVGIALSFIAGEVKRAPRWAQQSGLEWLHRLVQEPRRLARRYLLQGLPFAFFRLFPLAIIQGWRDGSDDPQAPEAPAPASPPAANRSAAGHNNPRDEGRTGHEGRHPRRRPGHSPEPPDQGHQQASPSRLRQAHDHVSDRVLAQRRNH
jgi:N-acetylglucosaminyldiphosphoundecaprenol N-acetyl-beta-D-mannosaminyltransferase